MSKARRIARWALPLALVAGGVSFATLRDEAPGAAQAPRGPRATPVRAAAATVGDLVLRETYPGELIADAVELAPPVVGRIAEVNVRVGDRVAAGTVVARLDQAQMRQQLLQAQAQTRAAAASEAQVDARIAAAGAELDRKRPLAERQLVSAQEFAELEANSSALQAQKAGARASLEQGRASATALQEQLRDLSLRAPFDALVASRLLEPGATASASTPVVRLVRAGPLEVRFRVPERDAGVVRIDLPLQIRTQATGAAAWPGKVVRIAGEVARADRSLLVEGLLQDEQAVLRAGMFATVDLTRETLRETTLVPSAALLDRRGSAGLFVVEGGTASWREVRVLGEEAGISAVEGALAAGDRVLVFGHDDLIDGAPIAVVETQNPATAGGAD